MISLLDTVFTEYTKAEIATNRLSTSFPGRGQTQIPKTMLKKAANASYRKRSALVHGAKKLLNVPSGHNLSHRTY